MTAETLRRAAALMRERAQAAKPDEEWWHPKPLASALVAAHKSVLAPDMAEAEHIASWHPLVALAVADWLDSEAKEFERLVLATGAVKILLRLSDQTHSVEATLGVGYNTLDQAVAVARAYLGEQA